MQETNLIKVTSVSEERGDKNGRIYKSVEFSNPSKMMVADESSGEIVQVRTDPKRCAVNRYKESYLNDKPHFMFDAKKGERTPGMVVTQPVAPYKIGEGEAAKMVDSYSAVVFGSTNSPMFEAWTVHAFKNANHPIRFYKSPAQIERELVAEAEADANFVKAEEIAIAEQPKKIEITEPITAKVEQTEPSEVVEPTKYLIPAGPVEAVKPKIVPIDVATTSPAPAILHVATQAPTLPVLEVEAAPISPTIVLPTVPVEAPEEDGNAFDTAAPILPAAELKF